ncbi:hypothetical protein [Actinocatenispora comari]|uniref:Uncharacterized protein n=1 Tax=Actinocatenispora comari TaxID=2807577 RepID=A0A8J4ADF9_9ACTN|nr:hypothetical protein [Actinocatenispora comari]GIL29023.1 hypothetical protein NUM_42770 [Actinocatenispora comari]
MKAFGMGHGHGEHGILKYTEPQIAVERVLPVRAPDGRDSARYARLATAGIRLPKRLPGVK